MATKKKTTPELKVVFDTNILYTKVAYDLLRDEIKSLLERNSHHQDLSVRWYLPAIVVDERRYQMQGKAFDLLPSVTALEKLLGHNLNITQDTLNHHIDEVINRQLKELNISCLKLDEKKVDWNALIKRAVYRNPPFKPGEKEKGLRDSIIAETFLQLVCESPITPSVCRLAIITNDKLLTVYIEEKIKGKNNVRVIPTIGDLESLINTLVSQVTEDFVKEIRKKVSEYFFDKANNPNTLYYKEKIWENIWGKYKEEFSEKTKDGLYKEYETILIDNPLFQSKKGQRTFWVTPINIAVKLYKYDYTQPIYTSALANVLANPTLDNTGQWYLSEKGEAKNYLAPFQSGAALATVDDIGLSTGMGASGFMSAIPQPNKIEVANGKISFEIFWSVNITTKKNLTSPRIEEIRFIATKYDEEFK